MNTIVPAHSLATQALMDLNNEFLRTAPTFKNNFDQPVEIKVSIENGVTHPKFAYTLNEYRAEVTADQFGKLSITLFHNHRSLITYSDTEGNRNELIVGAYADTILHWVINHVK